MRRFITRLRNRDDDRGATVPEYAILIAGAFSMVSGLGDGLGAGASGSFSNANDGVNGAAVQDVDGDAGDDDAGDEGDDEGSSGGGEFSGEESSGGGESSGGSGSTFAGAPGTGTIGYWKNHEEAWPATSLTIAGTTYSQDELLDIFDINGNKPANMAQQLIGVELNILAGNGYDCITDTVNEAHAWLATYPIGTSGGSVNSAWDDTGDDIKTMLDEYNNGNLDCADHRG